MLLLWTKNAGLYRHIHNEAPLRNDVAQAIISLQSQKKNFYVHCWESMYECYHSDMGIIDDETLEEVYVYHDCGQAFAPTSWWIVVSGEQEYTIKF